MRTLAALLAAAAPAAALRGLDPEKASLYAQTVDFSCLDGSGKGVVNDDYCDCADGSDEIGTSACANGVFYCENKGHRAARLFASRVDDGLCDCCDGTDEAAGVCANTCREAGAAAREQLEKDVAAYRAGLETATEYRSTALRQRGEWEAALKTMSEEKEQLATRLAKAEADLEAAKASKEAEDAAAAAAAASADEHADPDGIEEGDDGLHDVRMLVDEAKDSLSVHEKEMAELEEKLAGEYGDGDVFAALAGQCFTLQDTQYTYELCPFRGVEQSGTNLGKWDKWIDGHSKMFYGNGASCWQGPNRNTEVELQCGATNEVISVDEPSRCTYKMVFKTPAACQQAHLDALELEAALHDEL